MLLTRPVDLIHVEVTDDGIGGASVGGGSGLCGLKDRVDAVGARLHLVSAPGAGTRVIAELPLWTGGDVEAAPAASG